MSGDYNNRPVGKDGQPPRPTLTEAAGPARISKAVGASADRTMSTQPSREAQ